MKNIVLIVTINLLAESVFTNENLASFLEYVLIRVLNIILSFEIKEPSSIKKKVVEKDELELKKTVEKVGEDLKTADEDLSLSLDELITENMKEKADLVYDLLKLMKKTTEDMDKFTREKISESIERKNDIEKEENLKFIEELDKESRQAVKQMIATGLYEYKNLHKLKKMDVPDKDEVELGERTRCIK